MRFRFLYLLNLAGALVLWLTVSSVVRTNETNVNSVEKVVIPFISKHCIQCHGPEKKKADLALHVYKDEQAILKDRRVWDSVLHMVALGEMPPSGRPRPRLDEIDTLMKTVQGLFARADSARDPGLVTMRRLNRVDYANTIRDLVGVAFDGVNELPQDDVGYGFDNIGEVLTISPYLMERYLAAAETVMQRAILVNPPPPATRQMSGRYLEPAIDPSTVKRARPLFNKGKLHTPYKITQPGEYIFRVRCYGKQAGAQPVRISLEIDGVDLKTFDVKTADRMATTFEAKVKLTPGDHRGAVNFLNEYSKGDEKRGLYVEWLELTGPLDPRPPSQVKLLNASLFPGRGEGVRDKQQKYRDILGRFASRAYRRPATADEVDRLVKLVNQVEAAGEKWEAGMQLAMQAVLCSPKFLFRVELEPRPGNAPHPVDDYALASRLSYFLWSSMPDDELFALAAKNQLHANIEPQVRRMLQDEKARALVENFAMQWLQLRTLKNVAPDSKVFSTWNDDLRKSMYRETELFLEAIMREDRSILDIIDADFTFVDQRLAEHYDLPDRGKLFETRKSRFGRPIRSSEFKRVQLTDGMRGGILTQASVLTITSNPTRTSPVKRGRWILEQILGTPPPPPPPDVPELEEGEKAQAKGALRQRLEQHRSNPACANCHARMDPAGFALENFDAIGRFRSKDGPFPIDPSGTLPDGKVFNGPGEFKAILKEKKDLFARCLAEKMLTYAVGRGIEYYDRRALNGIVSGLAHSDYRFSALVVEVARSDPFRLKRGKDQQ